MIGLGKTNYGYRWGVSFLESDLQLTYDERLELITHATEMFLNEEKQREVKGKEYEGLIATDNKYHLLGSFGGKKFEAIVDVRDKHAYVSFLVKEYINPSLN